MNVQEEGVESKKIQRVACMPLKTRATQESQRNLLKTLQKEKGEVRRLL